MCSGLRALLVIIFLSPDTPVPWPNQVSFVFTVNRSKFWLFSNWLTEFPLFVVLEFRDPSDAPLLQQVIPHRFCGYWWFISTHILFGGHMEIPSFPVMLPKVLFCYYGCSVCFHGGFEKHSKLLSPSLLGKFWMYNRSRKKLQGNTVSFNNNAFL